MKANTMNPDQTTPKSLIRMHIVCIIGYQSTKADGEQTRIVMNGRKGFICVLYDVLF